MKRRAVKVIRCRIEDIQIGDVVNRNPDAEKGWFQVHSTSVLFDGRLQVADQSEQLSLSGMHKDIVGVQLVEEVEVDQYGRVVPAHAVATPMAPPVPMATPPQAAPSPAPQPAPAPPQPSPAPQAQPAPQPAPAPQAQPAAAETKAEDDEVVPDFAAPAAPVDLSKVLNLLEQIDAPEPAAPIRVELEPMVDGAEAAAAVAANAPADATPARPLTLDDVTAENARPVYGDVMPDKPSYLNPVVVSDSATKALPKRRSAA